jgi:hypothetical protein
MRRAPRLGLGGTSTRFPVGLSPTPVPSVSSGPPLLPDGRMSRVRFETAPRSFSLPGAFLPHPVLKPWSTSPPMLQFASEESYLPGQRVFSRGCHPAPAY